MNSEIYIGSTNNLKRRFSEHNSKTSPSTKRYAPWKLVYYEAYLDEHLARTREKRLKHHGNAIKELKKRVGLVHPAPLLTKHHLSKQNILATKKTLPHKTSLGKSGAGFTLIEVMVYLGLFSIIFGGTMVMVYSVFESSGINQTRAMVQEEGNFIAAKIGWALSGVRSVNTPFVGDIGSTLAVNKGGSVGTVDISLVGANVEVSRGGNPAQTLNNANVQISNLIFSHTSGSGDGINPESVAYRFTISGRAPNGAIILQEFATSTVYLRK